MKTSSPFAFTNRINIQTIREFSSRNAIVLVLAGLVIVIGIIQNSFFTLENLVNIMRISSVRLIIALGVGGILITGGTDLSAGRTVGLSAVIVASLVQRPDYASKLFPDLPYLVLFIPIIVAVLAGVLVGVINGICVAFLKVPPFIATLGSMVIVWGAASLYVDRPPRGAQPIGGLRSDFTDIGTGSLGFGSTWVIPTLILIAFVIFIFYWVMLNKTRLGKNIYAIGGNVSAANVSGVNVKKNLMIVYTLGGALYGLAGVLLAARSGGATNNYGQMYELDAIAAAVIGGVSTSGGIGTAGGILTGVLIFEVLNNGLVVLGVSAYWQQVIKGIIIIAAVALDIRKYTKKK